MLPGIIPTSRFDLRVNRAGYRLVGIERNLLVEFSQGLNITWQKRHSTKRGVFIRPSWALLSVLIVPVNSHDSRRKVVSSSDEQEACIRTTEKTYLEFAQIDTMSCSEVIRFANTYGLLGIETIRVPVTFPTQTTIVEGVKVISADYVDENPLKGECLGDWFDEIRAINLAVEKWRQIQGKDEKRAWEDKASREKTLLSFGHDLGNSLGAYCKPGVGLVYQNHANVDDEDQQEDIECYSMFLSSGLLPTNLIGAMWLQFANDVAANSPLVECEGCRKLFVPTRRDGKTHPEGGCRMKAWRQRNASRTKANVKQKSRKSKRQNRK